MSGVDAVEQPLEAGLAESGTEQLLLIEGASAQQGWGWRPLRVAALALGLLALACVAAISLRPRVASEQESSLEIVPEEPLEELLFELPASIESQCWDLYNKCKVTGFNDAGCKMGIDALIHYYKPVPQPGDHFTLFMRIMFDGGCFYDTPKCTADYNTPVGGGLADNQEGTLKGKWQRCPRRLPVCTGLVMGDGNIKTKGTCKGARPEGALPWPTGESLHCKNTPDWGNGWTGCSQQNGDPALCTPKGWTCSGYLRMIFCENGQPHNWGPGKDTTMGPTKNFPEKNCCVCGGGIRT